MNFKSIWAPLAFLTTLTLAVHIWRATAATRQTRRDIAAVQERTLAIDREIAKARARAAAEAQSQVQLKNAGTAKAESADRATSPSPAPAKVQPVQNPQELIQSDPKLQVLAFAAQRAQFDSAYGPFVWANHLSATQITRMREAIARFTEQQQDVMAVMREQKLQPDDPAIRRSLQDAKEEFDRTQLELLGADGFDQLQQYQRAMPARAIVGSFAGAAALGSMPLTPAQAEQLTQVIANANRAGRGRNDMSLIDWNAVDAQAGNILSPDQLALFQRVEIGGGASRWMSQFESAIQQARKTVAASKAKPGGP